jgi:hypothetical protein
LLSEETASANGPQHGDRHHKEIVMGLILLIVLILLLVGGLPAWGYSRKWATDPPACSDWSC